jgi:integrase/recombinase XerD
MTSLRKRMIEDLQVRNRSPHTQAAYIQQVSLSSRYFDKSPVLLDIRGYQIFLTNEKKLTPKSISVAVAALRFPYQEAMDDRGGSSTSQTTAKTTSHPGNNARSLR